jgi:hypothetical protein
MAGDTARRRPGVDRSPSAGRVMVVGDLLLPSEPSPSSLAACRDIAQTLSEWQGPGIVVICGQLVAPGAPRHLAPPRSFRSTAT